VTRILDLDLDFFVHGVATWRAVGSGRLEAADFPPWPVEDALSFLRDRCKLSDPLPGYVVENHGELFDLWGDAIAAGTLAVPLSVTHIDAHSDLGLGDDAYIKLITELLFLPIDQRRPGAKDLVTDGNYLAMAIACGWVSELNLVRNEEGNNDGRPEDLFPYYLESREATDIQLQAMTREQLDNRMYDREYEIEASDPKVPLVHMTWEQFDAPASFDVICLARSPDYTPAELDPLFDEIRERFVDEAAFSRERGVSA
jgi:hypothetical protein